ncbi:MAG: metal ABC transporter permease, partial [Alphaproteobacteria bacterium]|nr:metal ABC transporter permease [Alphaproteobacteria bacterium]
MGRRGTWATIRDLLPHLWPARGAGSGVGGEAETGLGIKARVVGALGCLVAAKAATVTIPLFYQAAVDALTKAPAGAPAGAPASDAALLAALPIALIVGYGVARVLSLAMNELRDALFAKVQQRAVRSLALLTFRHLHALSMRFHMERQTGGLARVIERGTKAIEGLIFYTLLSVVPTTVELMLACGVLWALFGISYAAIVLVTVALYGVWSVFVSEWRTRFRREMNEMDTAASSKAIDSLLNYETVKYFANEEHEARRY